MYEPSVYIVASGRKRGYLGDRCLVYDPNNYLVLSVPLPFECEAEIGDGEPLLGLSVRMEIGVISELAASMDVCLTQVSSHISAKVKLKQHRPRIYLNSRSALIVNKRSVRK